MSDPLSLLKNDCESKNTFLTAADHTVEVVETDAIISKADDKCQVKRSNNLFGNDSKGDSGLFGSDDDDDFVSDIQKEIQTFKIQNQEEIDKISRKGRQNDEDISKRIEKTQHNIANIKAILPTPQEDDDDEPQIILPSIEVVHAPLEPIKVRPAFELDSDLFADDTDDVAPVIQPKTNDIAKPVVKSNVIQSAGLSSLFDDDDDTSGNLFSNTAQEPEQISDNFDFSAYISQNK